MQKFIIACLLVVALVGRSTWAKPSYGGSSYGGPSYGGSSYGGPSYGGSSSYGSHLYPVGVQSGYGANVPPAPPVVLHAAPSHPSAVSSAVASQAALNPGHYTQLAVPAYEFLTGEVVNPAGGYPNVVSYGNAAY